MARKPSTPPRDAKLLRCAIYTRKSTEDGLEQEFNSLDAQREACAAYIVSQRHEGWTLAPGHYDDGGFSGGTMERPGLKRLLVEVEAGRVDVIVVYKVDRLTRSLADFAKIVEVLDAKGASFVSITQAFNTTTSMGRLTLNVLLSFAQFEREVTGERIRDKIAASKKKGMWMGGPVPLGYVVQYRKLVVEETEAELVRHIMRRYLALRSVKELVAELDHDGRRTKLQLRASGPHRGGCPFRRGTLYHLLANRAYLGEIVHKGVCYPGEHQPIVAAELFEQVKTKLAARGPGGPIAKERPEHRSALAGLLYDGLGRAMVPNHANKGTKRYRYYVTREPSPEAPAWRVGAHDLERLVAARISELLLDRHRIARLAIAVDPRGVDRAVEAAAKLAGGNILDAPRSFGIENVTLHEDRVDIVLREDQLLRACGVAIVDDRDARITISTEVARVRRGHELRLIVPGGEAAPVATASSDPKLITLMNEALAARELVLASPDETLRTIAERHGRCRKRLAKLVRLSWLAPDLVHDIAAGSQPAGMTASALLDLPLPIAWAAQRELAAVA